jgi:8-amino-7-oxononanoate synthase
MTSPNVVCLNDVVGRRDIESDAPMDPFHGMFDNALDAVLDLPSSLDTVRARRWFHSIQWTRDRGLYTYQQPLEGHSGNRARVGGRDFLMLSSYDYLGLIGHTQIERAAIEAIQEYGTGSGGVRLLTGTTRLHRQLEEELATFKGTEAALTFSSGYLANLGVIGALLEPQDRVIVDARAHRSIVDGCQLARVQLRSFRHNDMASLRRKLERDPNSGRTLIVVEGIYSMDGDICPLPEIVELKEAYGAMLLVDEAHSFGALGASGRGIHEHFGIPSDTVDIWMGSLSKAIPANGGFLAGSQAMIVYLQHEAAPFMFSAALCPASTAAAREALKVIDAEPWRIKALRRNTTRLRNGLQKLGYDTASSVTAIVPVVLNDDAAAYRLARRLYDLGILATAVVSPAVPLGTARLRLCAMATHTEDDLDEALRAFAAADKQKRQVIKTGEITAP